MENTMLEFDEFGFPQRDIAALLEQLRAAVHERAIDWSLPPEEALAALELDETALVDLDGEPWYGPLESWLHDPAVTDILVNGPGRPIVTVERGTRLPTDIRAHGDWIVFAQRQLLLRGGALEDNYGGWPASAVLGTADRWLRFAVTRAAASPCGPTIALRLLPRRWRTLDDLVLEGAITRPAADLLLDAVRGGATLLLAGGAGSGKTTLAAALLQAVGDEKRVVVIEEAAELPELPDGVALEVLRSGMSFAECVRFALRQRPDLIALGEVRGPEALALLQAAATGHPGVGTIHAPDPQTALKNLERMACESGDVPPAVVRGLIASGAAPLVVAHIGRYGGRRRVGRIEEALPQGAGGQNGDRYPAHTLFAYDPHADELRREGWVQAAWGQGRV
jgi:Flp pilus assembly CpaF family ATPase